MRTASCALLVSFMTVAVGCGGDDSSTTTAGAGGSGSTAATTGAGGGTSTGAGGSSSDSGTGCPSAQPAANDPCNVDHDCTYGSLTCSCVDMLWTCNGAPPEGGAGCPMADPDPGESCTQQGLICNYSGGLTCTCDTTDGWSCVQARAR